MPDPQLIAKACAASAVVAAALFFLIAFLPNPKHVDASRRRMQFAWPLGVFVGFYAGVWTLGLLPTWPPAEDRGRFLLIVLPLTVAIECAGAMASSLRWLTWLLRVTLSLAVGRILLHESVYLANEAVGHGDAAGVPWTALQSVCVLGGLGLALTLVWATLDYATHLYDSRVFPTTLAVTILATGVTVMLSGYATGGQLGFPLAAALTGTITASLLCRRRLEVNGSLGVGLIALFSLLVIGRFFSELAILHAILLAAVPAVVGIIFLLPLVPRLTWVRVATSLLVTASTLAIVIFQSGQQFAARSSAAPDTAGESSAPSFEDYMNFNK